MLQVDVCIEMIFTDRDFIARIDAVAEAGLPAFEFWGWRNKDLPAIIERQKRHGLAVANLEVDPKVDLLGGESIPAFVQGVREGCRVARQLGCKCLHTPVQDVPWGPGQPWYAYMGDERQTALHCSQRANVVRALKAAVPVAEGEGITLLLEPLNWLVNHAGYFVSSSREGFEILAEVDSPALRLLCDFYHQQITEGNLINTFTSHVKQMGHVHVADVPGRHEPGTGEINFLNVLGAVKRAGYDGYVGLEYEPSADSLSSMQLIRHIVDQVNLTEPVE